MMEKIKSFFKKNIGLKLLSGAIAIGIWLMVVNISNPEVKTGVNTAIGIDYGESLTSLDKYYSLDTETAHISYSVRTNQRRLISPSDFNVYVDMRDYSITGALPVYVELDESIKDIVSNVTVSPVVVHATTEDMQEKLFDLSADTVGKPSPGYAVGPIEYTPNRVTLYGPNSEIGKISRIGFNVNVENAVDNLWGTADFLYYDANDNLVSPDVRIVVKNNVSYIAPIYKKKNVSVTCQTFGQQADGYSLDSVDCDPSFIELYGDDELLENVNAIILPGGLLNISGATSDVTATIDIANYLPEGLYTDNVKNVALIARITRSKVVAPILESPEGTPVKPGDETVDGPGTSAAVDEKDSDKDKDKDIVKDKDIKDNDKDKDADTDDDSDSDNLPEDEEEDEAPSKSEKKETHEQDSKN